MSRFLCFTALMAFLSAVSATDDNDMREAIALIGNGQTQAALTLLERLSKAHPNAPEPYNNLAALAAQQGDLVSAELYLEKALNTQKSFKTSFDNIQSLRKSLALSSYRKSLDLSDPKPQVNLKLAHTLTTQGGTRIIEKPVEVIKEIETIVEVEVPATCPVTANAPAQTTCSSQTSAPKQSPGSMVKAWAKDWSDQNINAYIRHYVKGYSHGTDKSHADWIALRKKRLSSPSFINVDVREMTIDTIKSDLAVVSFTQHYQSNAINDAVKKLLILVNEGGKWKIKQERVLL